MTEASLDFFGGYEFVSNLSMTVWLAGICIGNTYVREGRDKALRGNKHTNPHNLYFPKTFEHKFAAFADYLMLAVIVTGSVVLTGNIAVSGIYFLYLRYFA